MGRIEEAQDILKSLGLPEAQQNEMSALTLLALVQVGPNDDWVSATRSRQSVTKGIMAFARSEYGRSYAPNTRETFRRQVLHQFIQARLADYNPFEPDLATNSPRAHYAISDEALTAIRTYSTETWESAAAQFLTQNGSLADTYARHRNSGTLVPVKLPDGSEVVLSPGRHNRIQKAIIEEFAPRFAPGSRVLYLGDTAKKTVVMEAEALIELGFDANEHEKLPDVVLYVEDRHWLYLVEAVSSHGPMSPKRVFELQERLASSSAGLIYVSAFPNMAVFRKHMSNVAWETEVWLADMPDHLIHFNGDRFFGPQEP